MFLCGEKRSVVFEQYKSRFESRDETSATQEKLNHCGAVGYKKFIRELKGKSGVNPALSP